MKRLLALCLLLLSLSISACVADKNDPQAESLDPADSETADVLQVGVIMDAEVVNIRQSASMDGRILDTARRGELFLVEESDILDAEGNFWVKIRYRGESAFVHSGYIYQMVWAENTAISIGEVMERDVYIYAAPDSNSDILYRSYKGEPLILYAADDEDWYKVFYSRGDAFVSASQIRVRTSYINELLE